MQADDPERDPDDPPSGGESPRAVDAKVEADPPAPAPPPVSPLEQAAGEDATVQANPLADVEAGLLALERTSIKAEAALKVPDEPPPRVVPAAPSAGTLVDHVYEAVVEEPSVITEVVRVPVAKPSEPGGPSVASETMPHARVTTDFSDPPSDETEIVRVPELRAPTPPPPAAEPEVVHAKVVEAEANVVVEAKVVEATIVEAEPKIVEATAKVVQATVVEAQVVEATAEVLPDATQVVEALFDASQVIEAQVIEAQVVEAEVVEARAVPSVEPRTKSKSPKDAVIDVEAEVVVEARAEIVDEIPQTAKRSDPPEWRRSSSHTSDAPRIVRSDRPSASAGSTSSRPPPQLGAADRPSSARTGSNPAFRGGSRPSVPALQVDEPPQQQAIDYLRKLARKPAAALGLVVFVYALIAYFAAARVSRERERVNVGLAKVEDIGQRATQAMLLVPTSELPPLLTACAGKLPRGAENSILAYAAGPSPELSAKLGARGAEFPAHEVIGSRDGEVDYVPVKDPTHISTLEVWTELLFGKPWHWDLAIDYRAQRGPSTVGMKLLIVSIVRDASIPRLLSESSFDGGTSLQHVRVVTGDGGVACEGALVTRMVMLEVGKEPAGKGKGDDILVIFGASPRAEAKYASQVRLAPMKSQCFIAGDASYCHSIDRALAQ